MKVTLKKNIVIRKKEACLILSQSWSRRYVYQSRVNQGKQNHCELWDKGFSTGSRASTVWGEGQVQDGVAGAESQKPGVPSCTVNGEGEGHGGLWGATLTCSSLDLRPHIGLWASGSHWSAGTDLLEVKWRAVRTSYNSPTSLRLCPHF